MVWWPQFIRKPRLRLSHVRLHAPPRPTTLSAFVITLIFLAFIFGGGVFMWVNSSESWLVPIISLSSYNTPLWPGLDRQLLLEGVAAMLFFCGSFLGEIIVYEASKYSYRRSYAQKLLILGWGIVVASFLGLWWMLYSKLALQTLLASS